MLSNEIKQQVSQVEKVVGEVRAKLHNATNQLLVLMKDLGSHGKPVTRVELRNLSEQIIQAKNQLDEISK